MFKAKLINNQKYYTLRRKQTWLMLLPSIPIGLMVNYMAFPIWVAILVVASYVALIVYATKNEKLLNAMLGIQTIEMDENEIRIKSKNGVSREVIPLEEIEELKIPGEYGIPQDSMKDFTNELAGKPKQNHLIVKYKNEERKFDFELNSHYMIKQLDKIIDNWSNRGLKIIKDL